MVVLLYCDEFNWLFAGLVSVLFVICLDVFLKKKKLAIICRQSFISVFKYTWMYFVVVTSDVFSAYRCHSMFQVLSSQK